MRHLAFFVLLLASIPAARASSELDWLQRDARLIGDQLDRMESEITREGQDAVWEDSAEVLPPMEEGVSSSSARSLEESPTHITVRVDGVPVTFGDVPRTEWFAAYVRDIVERGIVSGYRDEQGIPTGAFGPADNVTAEQLAKIAVLASGIDPASCTGEIRNPQARDGWSAPYIRCAEQRAWAVYVDGTILPRQRASRAEVVVTILQALGVPFRPIEESSFTDVNSSTQFRTAILTAAADSIVNGYTDGEGNLTGLFGPTDPVTRAEVAKIVVAGMSLYRE